MKLDYNICAKGCDKKQLIKMGNDIEDERAIREDQSKGSWELNRSIDERRSLALIMTVSKVIITITTRPKPPTVGKA